MRIPFPAAGVSSPNTGADLSPFLFYLTRPAGPGREKSENRVDKKP
jgi:hypothetical protein